MLLDCLLLIFLLLLFLLLLLIIITIIFIIIIIIVIIIIFICYYYYYYLLLFITILVICFDLFLTFLFLPGCMLSFNPNRICFVFLLIFVNICSQLAISTSRALVIYLLPIATN